jgi:hypothetical protein
MPKTVIVRCDVKPCTSIAEREIEVNGETFYICSESCFVKYWSRQYSDWKSKGYRIIVEFEPEPLRNLIPEAASRTNIKTA